MIQVDNKALYIEHQKDYTIIKSYQTPIVFLHNGKAYTTNTKYSKTTSRHKNHVINHFRFDKVVVIPQKVFNQTMIDNGVSLGIA